MPTKQEVLKQAFREMLNEFLGTKVRVVWNSVPGSNDPHKTHMTITGTLVKHPGQTDGYKVFGSENDGTYTFFDVDHVVRISSVPSYNQRNIYIG